LPFCAAHAVGEERSPAKSRGQPHDEQQRRRLAIPQPMIGDIDPRRPGAVGHLAFSLGRPADYPRGGAGTPFGSPGALPGVECRARTGAYCSCLEAPNMTRAKQACAARALLCLAAAAFWNLQAQPVTPVGRWRTVDDKTGKPKAIVVIYEESGLLFGRVEATLDPNAKKICDRCKDERKNQAIVGMVILRRLSAHGEEYSGGDILDPNNGSIYRCKLRLQDSGRQLSVRGFIGFSLLGRSQVWTREP
jgi:uncharacterized protein (DUF2147 family)